MSNIGETVIQLFNDWFLKQHGLLPQQAIDRINELEATIERVRIVRNDLATQCTNGHAVKALDKALREKDSE